MNATAKQISFIHSLDRRMGATRTVRFASQLQVVLPQRIRSRAIDQLTKSEASEIIDLQQEQI